MVVLIKQNIYNKLTKSFTISNIIGLGSYTHTHTQASNESEPNKLRVSERVREREHNDDDSDSNYGSLPSFALFAPCLL